ncbi:MAG: hypothetical protein ACFB0Z_00590 [Candidatus Phaeomarinobacter sp.]
MTVEFLRPDRRLEQLVGNTMPKQMPKAFADRTAAACRQAIDAAHDGMLEEIAALWCLVDDSGDRTQKQLDEIYFKSHDLRGLCGTMEETILAGIADALCSYIEESRTLNLTPRSNIIWLHASSLLRASQEEDTTNALGQYLIESLCALRKKELEISCPDGCNCSFHY